jgi:exonuclease III
MNHRIKIVQWNCRSLRSKFPELQQRSQNIDIIILSETWLDEAENVYLTGFDVVRKDRNERAGGVAIFINNKLKYSRKEGLYDGDGKIEVCQLKYILARKKYQLYHVTSSHT